MSGFSVSVGALLGVAGPVTELAEDAGAGLRRLDAAAEDLLGTRWAGPAASAYRSEWQLWRSGAQKVLEALDEMSAALHRAAADYADREQASTTGFERIAP